RSKASTLCSSPKLVGRSPTQYATPVTAAQRFGSRTHSSAVRRSHTDLMPSEVRWAWSASVNPLMLPERYSLPHLIRRPSRTPYPPISRKLRPPCSGGTRRTCHPGPSSTAIGAEGCSCCWDTRTPLHWLRKRPGLLPLSEPHAKQTNPHRP